MGCKNCTKRWVNSLGGQPFVFRGIDSPTSSDLRWSMSLTNAGENGDEWGVASQWIKKITGQTMVILGSYYLASVCMGENVIRVKSFLGYI